VRRDPALVQKNLIAIKDLLTKTRKLPLLDRDLEAIDAVGIERSYLATEAGFAWLKDLQSRNLVVPVVGDFGGPKAIRAVGQYLKSRGGRGGGFINSLGAIDTEVRACAK
jgi:hypothetical protein